MVSTIPVSTETRRGRAICAKSSLTTQLILRRLLDLHPLPANIHSLKPICRIVSQILFVQLLRRDRLLERIANWHLEKDIVTVV